MVSFKITTVLALAATFSGVVSMLVATVTNAQKNNLGPLIGNIFARMNLPIDSTLLDLIPKFDGKTLSREEVLEVLCFLGDCNPPVPALHNGIAAKEGEMQVRGHYEKLLTYAVSKHVFENYIVCEDRCLYSGWGEMTEGFDHRQLFEIVKMLAKTDPKVVKDEFHQNYAEYHMNKKGRNFWEA